MNSMNTYFIPSIEGGKALPIIIFLVLEFLDYNIACVPISEEANMTQFRLSID